MTRTAQEEIQRGERFPFGKNWKRFLSVLSDARIKEASDALQAMLGSPDLTAKTFLDVGSGSGIMSLAARRLGAKVVSFDYDPHSVACTHEVKRRYLSNDPHWIIEQGSALDLEYLAAKGHFDVVYSWGVLHHTGDLWRAIENVSTLVAPGGRLFIAIYNDQGVVSVAWRKIKQIYCKGLPGRILVGSVFVPYFVLGAFLKDAMAGKNPLVRYFRPSARGMSFVRDWWDWLGGLPFEVAKPEAVITFLQKRGFVLSKLVDVGGRLGNNEFVFVRAL